MTSAIVQEAPSLRYGWRTVRIGDAAAIIMGQSPEGESYNREGRGSPLLNGPTEFGAEHPIAVQWTTSPTKFCRAGDILLCVRGNTVGRMNVADREYCIGRGLAAVRGRDGLTDTEFLKLTLHLATERILAESSGSTFPNISGERLASLEMRLPPLDEQRRIAARLNAQIAGAASARSAAKAQAVAIGAFLDSALGAAFQNIVPLSTGSSAATPPGWRWRPLLDLARLESGHTPSRKRPEWWGGEVRWMALPDIRRLDCREARETLERTNADGLANSSARMLPPGTVCLSRTASVGFVTILGREMATSQDFVNWICGSELDPWFLLWALRASRGFIRSKSTGAIHKTVYLPVAKSFEICAPPLAEQQRIAARLREQFAEIERARAAAAAQLEAIAALPGAYLREAFACT